MIEFVRENISWIKDLSTIILTVTATIIGYLTYKRARATILQPIRSEVIKKQVEILTEILTFLSSQNYSTKSLYDYFDLLSINTEIFLDDIGLKKMNDDERKSVNARLMGWVLFLNKDKSEFVYVTGNLDDFRDSLKQIDKEKRQKNLMTLVKREQDLGLSVLYFTHHYYESYLKISKYSENPLLPISTIKPLVKMKFDGKFNLLINLEETIVEHLRGYYDLVEKQNTTYYEVSILNRKSHDSFERKRFKHEDSIDELKNEIRQHLRIDDRW
jgi:hypothetical protein